MKLYDWADVIVVPLRPNTHASGITVMLEAAAVGKPMVVTNVGALQDYFPASETFYIPPFNPPALRDAVDQLAAAPVDALRQAQAAAAGLLARDLTTEHYAMQHVRITQEMLRARAGVRGRGAQAPTRTRPRARPRITPQAGKRRPAPRKNRAEVCKRCRCSASGLSAYARHTWHVQRCRGGGRAGRRGEAAANDCTIGDALAHHGGADRRASRHGVDARVSRPLAILTGLWLYFKSPARYIGFMWWLSGF